MHWTQPILWLLALAAGVIYWFARRARARLEVRPSVAFYPIAADAPRARAQRPPLSAWFAILAVLCAAAGAAGPQIDGLLEGPPQVTILWDRSARMLWRDGSGAARLDRARRTLDSRLAGLPKSTEITFYPFPGTPARGNADTIRALVNPLIAEPLYLDISSAVRSISTALPPAGRVELYTGEIVDIEGVTDLFIFGASGANAGLAPGLDGTRSVLVVNSGTAAARRRLVAGAQMLELELKAGESRLVSLSDPSAATARLEGGPDALDPDNEISIGPVSLNLQLSAETPAALRTALEAVAAARGAAAGSASVELWCVPAGSTETREPRIEFVTSPRGESRPLAQPGHAFSLAPWPEHVRAETVNCNERWVLDDRGGTLAGVSGRVARLGLDCNDRALVDSAAFPILLLSMVDRIVPKPSDRDPRISADSGSPVESYHSRAAKTGGSESRSFAALAVAVAAAAALAAAALVSKGL